MECYSALVMINEEQKLEHSLASITQGQGDNLHQDIPVPFIFGLGTPTINLKLVANSVIPSFIFRCVKHTDSFVIMDTW